MTVYGPKDLSFGYKVHIKLLIEIHVRERNKARNIPISFDQFWEWREQEHEAYFFVDFFNFNTRLTYMLSHFQRRDPFQTILFTIWTGVIYDHN